jgi:hypothetical protein
MIKITAALLVAGAVAVAPPRIELNLGAAAVIDQSTFASTRLYQSISSHVQGGNSEHSAFTNGAGQDDLMTPTYDATGTKTGETTVQQRQDWSQQCAAGAMTLTNCPAPSCNAYDHNDKRLSCHEHRYLVDFENANKWGEDSLPKKFADVSNGAGGTMPAAYGTDFANKRATWLFKYDAKDDAGNRAEQVVFALIVNDISPPVITGCYGAAGTSVVIEAASTCGGARGANPVRKNRGFCRRDLQQVNAPALGTNVRVPMVDANGDQVWGSTPRASAGNKFTATDNIDSDAILESETHMKFDVLEGENMLVTGGTIEQVRQALDSKLTSPLGLTRRATVTATTHDNAGYYGTEGFDNTATFNIDVTIADTVGPTIHYQGTSVAYGECCRSGVKSATCNAQTWAGYTETFHKATDANDGDISHEVIIGTGNVPNTTLYSDGVLRSDKTTTVDLTAKTTKDSPKKVYQYVQDAAGNFGEYNQLTYAVRDVHVVDRLPPTVTLIGSSSVLLKSKQANRENSGYVESMDPGYLQSDTCTVDNNLVCTTTWKDNLEPDFSKLQDYVREYKCCDTANACSLTVGTDDWVAFNSEGVATNCCADSDGKAIECCDTKTRTFSMVDDQAPTLLVLGSDGSLTNETEITVELSNLQEYTDAGAKCDDYVDGVLSHAVEVSGDVVDMRTAGDYKVRYDCTDLSGHAAKFATRTVKVRDTRAPNVTLVGKPVLYQEAGFKYTDRGITAVDADQDGDIDTSVHWVDPAGTALTGTAGCLTWGNTVNEAHYFSTVSDCRSIYKQSGGKAPSGKYFVNGDVEVWCDMTSGSIKTLAEIKDATVDAVPMSTAGDNDCKHFKDASGASWSMATFPNAINLENAKLVFPATEDIDYFPTAKDQAQGQYLCSPNDEAASPHSSESLAAEAAYAPEAAVGVFEITYYCKDSAGNKDQAWEAGKPVSREVHIVDTLAPVITLHMGKSLLASSVPTTRTRGVGNRINPAEQSQSENSAYGNPHLQDKLLATTSTASLNGWIVGALASAVSGLALLGYSFRKTHVVTSVPV